MRVSSAVAAVLIAALPAHGVSQPIQVDGVFSDWEPTLLATDAAGDGGVSGIDFLGLYAANDDARLYLRFDTTIEVQLDEFQQMLLALDTDANPATGQPIGSLGAELVWRFGDRTGTFSWGGQSSSIGHADIGLFSAPTVSATEFEIALDRNAEPAGGNPLFPGSSVRVALVDEASGGDSFEAPMSYVFDASGEPTPSLTFDRVAGADVRVAGWNIENDGLFDGGARENAIGRMFAAIDADLWIISEVWGHSAGQVAAEVEGHLPSGPGEAWSAIKLDGGNVIVSRFPVLASWEIFPGNRLTAVLVDPRPSIDADLLLVGNHWSCCTDDEGRQEQADALVAFLRDARTPGGVIDLVPDTPIVAAGDFNLVGWRSQLETVRTGDIADNGTWGPDSPPDWDGTDLKDVIARHPDARLTSTWWRDSSTFPPGRLDWIFYTDSVLELRNHLVVETRSMVPASLSAAGLQASDTVVASDHAPIVGDFRRPGDPVGVAGTWPNESALRLEPPSPNPFRSSTRLRFTLSTRGSVRLSIHDVGGRLVRLLEESEREPGQWTLGWNGRDESGRAVSAGPYYVRLALGEDRVHQKVVILR